MVPLPYTKPVYMYLCISESPLAVLSNRVLLKYIHENIIQLVP